jgi:hypothetical protein
MLGAQRAPSRIMTRLGDANPLYCLGRTVLGWLDAPQPGRHAPRTA